MPVLRHKHALGGLQRTLPDLGLQGSVGRTGQDAVVFGIRHIDRAVIRYKQVVRIGEGLVAELDDRLLCQVCGLGFLDVSVAVHRVGDVGRIRPGRGKQHQEKHQRCQQPRGKSLPGFSIPFHGFLSLPVMHVT